MNNPKATKRKKNMDSAIVAQLEKFLSTEYKIDFFFDPKTATVGLIQHDEFLKLVELLREKNAPQS